LNIAATVELLNTTSGELSSVKLDLAAAVMKLGEMNNELIQVKKDFTIKLEGNFHSTREFHQVIVIELQSLQNF
jgi:hypothetical protein